MAWTDFLFKYSSVRYVQVDAKCPGIIFRCLQFAIVAYVIVFSVVLKQAYQEYDNVVAETFSKMKGSAESKGQILDATDLVVPAQMQNALFITTNTVVNTEKRDTVCALYDTIKKKASSGCGKDGSVHCLCTTENVKTNCPDGVFVTYKNFGAMTGACVKEDGVTPVSAGEHGYCQVKGWCTYDQAGAPALPNDPDQPDNVISGIGEWSLFVRLNAAFPNFGVKINTAEKKLISGENQWLINDILTGAGQTYEDVAAEGAIILMDAKFDCNFNQNKANCKPTWEFSRLDKTSGADNFSTGFNFYDVKYSNATSDLRTVTKRFGIKLELNVSGRGGQFSIVNCLIALGAGMALLSVASLVTDFVLQHFWIGKQVYLNSKFVDIHADGAGAFADRPNSGAHNNYNLMPAERTTGP